jgi:hypothetical protein
MHKFSGNDLSFLIGSTLTQAVLVTKWCVKFSFSDLTSITIEKEFEHWHSRHNKVYRYDLEKDVQDTPIFFLEMFECSITNISVGDYVLGLEFDNGDLLVIKSDDGALECGQITKPGLFIVF